MTDLIRERLKSVPNRPGCYLMRDRRGVIIYVGKAKNLRRRVSSYFRPGAKHPPKVRSMVDTVYDFEFMTVRNEAESLLTEASLIKKYKPHFNILMRDDKRYLALRADPTADWPRFQCVRIVRDDGARGLVRLRGAELARRRLVRRRGARVRRGRRRRRDLGLRVIRPHARQMRAADERGRQQQQARDQFLSYLHLVHSFSFTIHYHIITAGGTSSRGPVRYPRALSSRWRAARADM